MAQLTRRVAGLSYRLMGHVYLGGQTRERGEQYLAIQEGFQRR